MGSEFHLNLNNTIFVLCSFPVVLCWCTPPPQKKKQNRETQPSTDMTLCQDGKPSCLARLLAGGMKIPDTCCPTWDNEHSKTRLQSKPQLLSSPPLQPQLSQLHHPSAKPFLLGNLSLCGLNWICNFIFSLGALTTLELFRFTMKTTNK